MIGQTSTLCAGWNVRGCRESSNLTAWNPAEH